MKNAKRRKVELLLLIQIFLQIIDKAKIFAFRIIIDG